jgi:hypothetical protein
VRISSISPSRWSLAARMRPSWWPLHVGERVELSSVSRSAYPCTAVSGVRNSCEIVPRRSSWRDSRRRLVAREVGLAQQLLRAAGGEGGGLARRLRHPVRLLRCRVQPRVVHGHRAAPPQVLGQQQVLGVVPPPVVGDEGDGPQRPPPRAHGHHEERLRAEPLQQRAVLLLRDALQHVLVGEDELRLAGADHPRRAQRIVAVPAGGSRRTRGRCAASPRRGGSPPRGGWCRPAPPRPPCTRCRSAAAPAPPPSPASSRSRATPPGSGWSPPGSPGACEGPPSRSRRSSRRPGWSWSYQALDR